MHHLCKSYKEPKYQTWSASAVLNSQNLGFSIWSISVVSDPVDRYGQFLKFQKLYTRLILNLVRIVGPIWPRLQFLCLAYKRAATSNRQIFKFCIPKWTNFENHIKSWHTRKNVNFGLNRTFHVGRSRVCRFDLYDRYWNLLSKIGHFKKLQILCASSQFFWPCLKSQYFKWTYTGANRFCDPICLIN